MTTHLGRAVELMVSEISPRALLTEEDVGQLSDVRDRASGQHRRIEDTGTVQR